jgi:hypothetical protein
VHRDQAQAKIADPVQQPMQGRLIGDHPEMTVSVPTVATRSPSNQANHSSLRTPSTLIS